MVFIELTLTYSQLFDYFKQLSDENVFRAVYGSGSRFSFVVQESSGVDSSAGGSSQQDFQVSRITKDSDGGGFGSTGGSSNVYGTATGLRSEVSGSFVKSPFVGRTFGGLPSSGPCVESRLPFAAHSRGDDSGFKLSQKGDVQQPSAASVPMRKVCVSDSVVGSTGGGGFVPMALGATGSDRQSGKRRRGRRSRRASSARSSGAVDPLRQEWWRPGVSAESAAGFRPQFFSDRNVNSGSVYSDARFSGGFGRGHDKVHLCRGGGFLGSGGGSSRSGSAIASGRYHSSRGAYCARNREFCRSKGQCEQGVGYTLTDLVLGDIVRQNASLLAHVSWLEDHAIIPV